MRSYFREDRAIRGGVPICFPWFGPHPSDPTAPAHGFARLADWTLVDSSDDPDATVRLTFVLEADEHTSSAWPHPCRLTYSASIGSTLAMSLQVDNRSAGPFTFEAALHTYLAISDIGQVSITGLEETEYRADVSLR